MVSATTFTTASHDCRVDLPIGNASTLELRRSLGEFFFPDSFFHTIKVFAQAT